jgi:hypothetical protein
MTSPSVLTVLTKLLFVVGSNIYLSNIILCRVLSDVTPTLPAVNCVYY